uniref:Uncharacterized protein n=1 Tax=Anguilla anguilla TaxID=7936 RepID=A0A0E9PSM7_ANGAN
MSLPYILMYVYIYREFSWHGLSLLVPLDGCFIAFLAQENAPCSKIQQHHSLEL